MKGLYLYCIREKYHGECAEKGIDGGKVQIFPYQDLEAVVSEVSLEKFSSEKIQKKAQEDLTWIKEKAQIHEKVIEGAMGMGMKNYSHVPIRIAEGRRPKAGYSHTVIPMKFGTIFKTKEKLKDTLKKNYFYFKKTLKNLSGNQEWGVKVYFNRKISEKHIKKVNPVIQKKEKKLASLAEGTAYFLQKEIDNLVARIANSILQKYKKFFYEDLKRNAIAGTFGKILEKELTGKSLPMVLNHIFLVPENKVNSFIKEVKNLNKKFEPQGFVFESSGPWPPYHFV